MFEDQFKKRQRGTGFTNIQRILNANVGAGQQMAGKISQGIQSAGQNVQQKAQKAQQQFKSAFEQAVNPAMQNIAAGSELAKRPDESQEDYAKRISEANKNYLEIGKNVSQAKYGGPMNIQGGKALVGEAQGVSTLGGLAGTGTGQQLLSKQYVAGRQGGYSKGQGALDQLLLGQSREAQKSLQEARQDVSGIGKEVGGIEKAATSDVANIRRQIEQQKSEAFKGVQKSIGGLEQAAREAGSKYSKEAGRIAYLLKNMDPTGKKIPIGMVDGEYSDAQAQIDNQLLNKEKLKEFGIDIEAKGFLDYDPTAIASSLQELSNKADIAANTRYSDAQKEALKRLTQFQQDQEKATRIGEMKNKEAFDVSDKSIKNLTVLEKQYETLEKQKADNELESKKLSDILSSKDKRQFVPFHEGLMYSRGERTRSMDNEKFILDAAAILGEQKIREIFKRRSDEATNWMGISKEKYSTTQNKIRDEIAGLLANRLNYHQNMYNDAISKMSSSSSLKDILSKYYGVK